VPLQTSGTSQAPAAARHVVPAGATVSAHTIDAPVQVSATSQLDTAGRQTVPAGTSASGGHATELPVQRSTASQLSAALRHTTPAPTSVSAGHVNDDPSQTSAMSHGPLAFRQIVPAIAAVSSGHSGLAPVHRSVTPQIPIGGRHVTPFPISVSAGHAALMPVHVSAMSHVPAAARHSVGLGANSSTGQRGLAPVHASAMSHGPADPRQVDPAGSTMSGGQLALALVQVSALSQTSAAARQMTVGATAAESSPQTPSTPPVSAALHAWQPPHGVPQQTPDAQMPLAQTASPPQVEPFGASAIVNTRRLPASMPPVVSSRAAPTNARVPSEESATALPRPSFARPSGARSVAPSAQLVPERTNTRTEPTFTRVVSSPLAAISARLPSADSVSGPPKLSPGAAPAARSTDSRDQTDPAREYTTAAPALTPTAVLAVPAPTSARVPSAAIATLAPNEPFPISPGGGANIASKAQVAPVRTKTCTPLEP
jgi:hypothetical protein